MSGMLRDSDDAGLVEELQPSACNWDCETVLSNYSNIDNHPGVLHEPSGRCVLAVSVHACRMLVCKSAISGAKEFPLVLQIEASQMEQEHTP